MTRPPPVPASGSPAGTATVPASAGSDREAIVAAADAVGEVVARRAADGERLGTLPSEVVDALGRHGLFRMGLPRALGGWETDPETFVRAVERVSHADGSAGWCTFLGNSSLFFAWLDPVVATGLVGDDPDRVSTSVFSPSATATVTGTGYRLSGRWELNSGAPHATWFIGGFRVEGSDPGGGPPVRWAVYPASRGRIDPTWRGALGLRATGSHDVVVEDLPVPRALTIAPFDEPARYDGALYAIPFPALLHILMIGFPLGVARRALDEFGVHATRTARTRADHRLAEDDDVTTRLAIAECGVRGARSHAYDAVRRVWDETLAGEVSTAARIDLGLAAQNALRAGLAAVDTVHGLCGADVLRDGNVLQRCWRDLHAGAHHIVFSRERLRSCARGLLGRPVDPTHL